MSGVDDHRQLASIPIFDGLDGEDLQRLNQRLLRKNFRPGAFIITVEKTGELVYMLLEGTVKIFVDQIDGSEVILAFLGSGDTFGEMSLLDSAGRSANVLALEQCSCLGIVQETWQWLAGRKAQDQILIAVKNNRQRSSDSAADLDAVGYAIVRDSCIVEMLTLPGFSAARAMLVARACRDAIDRDHHFVSLHTPAADPMHELMVTAGGSWISDGASTGSQSIVICCVTVARSTPSSTTSVTG